MALLEINNLSFQVGTEKILDGLSLSVEAAEVHAVLGTNGTGKSTLAYLIVGSEGYMPTAGTIFFDGQPIHTSKIHERGQLGITMAWQEPVRFEGISVAQYLTLKDRHLDPTPFLRMVGLEPARYLPRMVDRSLSGGERKRIELASILALHPRLAIFDEPDSGIDMLSINDIINVINACKKSGSAVLLITHREEIALSAWQIEGVEVKAEETASGISAQVRVRQGVRLKNPVQFCFAVLHKKATQNIHMKVYLEKNASASFIAHCIFPDAERVVHTMDGLIDIGEGAEMRYCETNFHGSSGRVEAIPRAVVSVGRNGRYFGEFNLVTGRVGRLAIDYLVLVEENGVVEMTARIFGHGHDTIVIKEKVVLAGENSRGLIKTRVAIEDEASAEITGITEGNAAGARGHVDCLEIVKDQAVATAIPLVRVSNPLAKVTHEAAIGSVDKRQLETLMLHGLSPEEAVDIIVKGILR